MEAIGNLVNKYFYTRHGELASGGSALITTGILALCGAIGAGSIKLGSMVWDRCSRPSARVPAAPVPNADSRRERITN
jgi:hypothetical protein